MGRKQLAVENFTCGCRNPWQPFFSMGRFVFGFANPMQTERVWDERGCLETRDVIRAACQCYDVSEITHTAHIKPRHHHSAAARFLAALRVGFVFAWARRFNNWAR